MGPARPHLVVADVENLPIQSGIADAVLAYESFHHLPNRPAAMRSYDRALKADGRVVLAEPGAAHEDAQVSVDVMKKYGILEKGMELEDVVGYATGTALAGPSRRTSCARAARTSTGRSMSPSSRRMVVTNNLFTLTKGGAAGAGAVPGRRRRVWPRVKRRLKSALLESGSIDVRLSSGCGELRRRVPTRRRADNRTAGTSSGWPSSARSPIASSPTSNPGGCSMPAARWDCWSRRCAPAAWTPKASTSRPMRSRRHTSDRRALPATGVDC